MTKSKPQFKRWYSSRDFECDKKANIVLIGAGWWAQGWHLPHLHRNEEVTISAIVGEYQYMYDLLEEQFTLSMCAVVSMNALSSRVQFINGAIRDCSLFNNLT
jgi:hypothetical protein